MTKPKLKKWLKIANNTILKAKWGRISYNPDTANGHNALMTTDLLNIFGQNVVDGEETALFDGKIWRILTGDFRKEYEDVFPSLKKCIEVYEKYKRKYRNNYSTD